MGRYTRELGRKSTPTKSGRYVEVAVMVPARMDAPGVRDRLSHAMGRAVEGLNTEGLDEKTVDALVQGLMDMFIEGYEAASRPGHTDPAIEAAARELVSHGADLVTPERRTTELVESYLDQPSKTPTV